MSCDTVLRFGGNCDGVVWQGMAVQVGSRCVLVMMKCRAIVGVQCEKHIVLVHRWIDIRGQ